MPTTELFRDHLTHLDRWLADALERSARHGAGFDAVLFYAGNEVVYFADDEVVPFHTAAHCRRWAPEAGPQTCVLARPGAKTKVLRVRSRDYWVDTSPPRDSYWNEAVEVLEVERLDQAAAALDLPANTAYVGPDDASSGAEALGLSAINPSTLLAPLDWHRATKTKFEVAQLRRAIAHSAAGHQAARNAFEAKGSERQVYWSYLQGADIVDFDVPFRPIVALDHKASILHYQHKRGNTDPGTVALIDAGASWEGYHADLTRTWYRENGPLADSVFRHILDGMDQLQRQLVDGVRPGKSFVELHEETHRGIANLLHNVGVFRVSRDEAFESGLTRAFLPHGLGHHLGLQVHDVGGHQSEPDGGTTPPPAEYPSLRNTRTLEPGHVVTIEPGLYFIPMLLDPLRQGEHSAHLDWDILDRLIPLGGIRIEDDVVCTDGGPEDLSRPLLPGA
ncbi:MAG: Xaa-Pro dipeptidase [Acidobacteriota bacterium]